MWKVLQVFQNHVEKTVTTWYQWNIQHFETPRQSSASSQLPYCCIIGRAERAHTYVVVSMRMRYMCAFLSVVVFVGEGKERESDVPANLCIVVGCATKRARGYRDRRGKGGQLDVVCGTGLYRLGGTFLGLDELQANLTRTGRSGYRQKGIGSWLSTAGTCGECVSDCCEFHSICFSSHRD